MQTESKSTNEAIFSRISFSASEVSDEVANLARKNMQVVLRKMQIVGQVAIAKSLDVAESNISRYKSNELERACLYFAACGIEFPSEDKRLYSEPVVEALRVLAHANLGSIKTEKPEVSGN